MEFSQGYVTVESDVVSLIRDTVIIIVNIIEGEVYMQKITPKHHKHEQLQTKKIIYVISGNGILETFDEKYEITEGDHPDKNCFQQS